jgi:hypothetical protein
MARHLETSQSASESKGLPRCRVGAQKPRDRRRSGERLPQSNRTYAATRPPASAPTRGRTNAGLASSRRASRNAPRAGPRFGSVRRGSSIETLPPSTSRLTRTPCSSLSAMAQRTPGALRRPPLHPSAPSAQMTGVVQPLVSVGRGEIHRLRAALRRTAAVGKAIVLALRQELDGATGRPRWLRSRAPGHSS